MKLSNIVSKDLLPDFAESISWVMNALDSIIQVIKARSVSIDAPLTMESIEALTDEELQALYAQYGLALYYPDISRSRRNWMLYNMARIWRYLGTPKAVEFLCKYVFSDIDIELKVHDNGAFDSEGRLLNHDLVDVFDIEIIPGVTILPPEANQRILENVIRFSRNSQALRQIYYSYDTFVSQTVSPALPYNGIVAVENVLNEAVCEDSPEPPGPTLPIVNTSNSNWLTTSTGREVTISANGTTGGYNYDGSSYYQESYDSTKAYAIRMWYDDTPTLMGHSGIYLVNQNGYVVIQNLLSVSTKFCQCYYATCSSDQASVVTVYNTSNEAFNAFKYTASGTDYYYVLDEIQTDWTDDLSSIGYYLPIVGYANQQKTQMFINNNSSPETPLFDEDGRYLTYDATKQNIIVGFWTSADGSKQSTPSGFYIYHNTSQTIYTFFYYKSGGSGTYFQRLEFILVPK